eukprot:m.242785 g.242785  ORF g.242785 m.242785 type:complete len:631 (+) comp54447_c0_seq4:2216-4108(+)
MFAPVGKHYKAYAKLKESALTGECTVLVLVAPDVDSLCAAWMLTTLLRGDFILYEMIPIANYDDLMQTKERIKRESDKIKSVILLNCGGTTSLLDDFEANDDEPNSKITFYIIDSHRPLHLANVFDTDRVIIFDDGQTQDTIPDSSEVQLSDSEDDEDDEDDRELDSPNSKRRRDQNGDYEPMSKRDLRMERNMRQKEYYAKTSYGVSAAVVLLELVKDQGKVSPFLVATAAVGLTDQHIHERIALEAYERQYKSIQDYVARLPASDSDSFDQKTLDRLNITSEPDYCFMLLRHWSLYESMYHSRYVASRLETWKQSGRNQLHNLFAMMGFSLDQCKQKFNSMGVQLRDSLAQRLSEHADRYNLEDFQFPSFMFRFGFRQQLSASDMVYSVAALLQTTDDTETENDAWRTSFFRAFDALAITKDRSYQLLKTGMDLAMTQQQAILRQVEAIVEGKNGIKKHTSFRYAAIKDTPDRKFFAHPTTLTNLGFLLLDTYRNKKEKDNKRKATLPFLLAASQPAKSTNMVVGIWNIEGTTFDSRQNGFGQLFISAGERVQARMRMTSFDSSGSFVLAVLHLPFFCSPSVTSSSLELQKRSFSSFLSCAVMEIKSDDMLKFITALQQALGRDYTVA